MLRGEADDSKDNNQISIKSYSSQKRNDLLYDIYSILKFVKFIIIIYQTSIDIKDINKQVANKEELKEVKQEIENKDITAEAPDARPDFIIK